MAGNTNTFARSFARTATRFSRLLVKLRATKQDSADYGDYAASPMAVIQLPPGQTADAFEVQDYQGNILFAIDASGAQIRSGVTALKSYVKQVTLTAAQITTLNSAPVTLIAAPGAGKAILVHNLKFQFKYGTVQFTGGGATNAVYHGATTNLLSGSVAAATIQAAANATISAGAEAAALSLTTNTGVDLYAATADFAAGDSTAIVTVQYSVLTLG